LALELLDRTSLLADVLPEVAAMKGVQQPKEFHPEGDVFKHTKLLMKQLKNASSVLAFGCLLHDVGKPPTFQRADRIRFNGHDVVGARMTEAILERLKFPNDFKESVVACVEGHMRFKDVKQMRESTLKRFLRRPTFETELEQHRIDCLASHGNLSNWRFLKKKTKQFGEAEIRPQRLLTGHDLIALGLAEGPQIGKALHSLEEAQLEGKIADREAAVEWLRAHFSPPPSNRSPEKPL
jgi:poly(A) polymerase